MTSNRERSPLPRTQPTVQTGALLIADLSGYTRYLASIDLNTAHVVCGLLDTIAEALTPFTVAKIEGDAVFCYATDELRETHNPLDIISSAHQAFVRESSWIGEQSGCTCPACDLVGTVGVKFVLHHGEFAIHQIAGHDELVGSDVIAVHRLVKGAVEEPGPRDYVLATIAWTDAFGVDVSALNRGTATYDHVGPIEFVILEFERVLPAGAHDRPRQDNACTYVAPPGRNSARGS